ncbi:hypothetical protein RB595_002700 [Gaeumannomyces hyphopodioides]
MELKLESSTPRSFYHSKQPPTQLQVLIPWKAVEPSTWCCGQDSERPPSQTRSGPFYIQFQLPPPRLLPPSLEHSPIANMSSSNKRHSVMPAAAQAGPKAPVIFSSSITIADQAMLSGMYPITVSSESVIHPRARFDSAGGPVNVGRRCIVHERAVLGAPGTNNHYVEGSVTLADLVTVEAAAVVECGGTYVGEGTTVGVGCRIGAGASIGKYLITNDSTALSLPCPPLRRAKRYQTSPSYTPTA